ncbi:MAG: AraC family transcriptional regulator [Desulfobacter sp.]
MDKSTSSRPGIGKLTGTTLFTLEGSLASFSTETLHHHTCHQLLRIRSGTTLLVEKNWQQPLFSNMTAFIPAGLPHRSVVLGLGEPVHYKSLYMDTEYWPRAMDKIIIFDMSDLGVALFDRLRLDNPGPATGKQDAGDNGFQNKCLDLLLTMLPGEMVRLSNITRVPVPKTPDNIKITEFIKTHFREKLSLDDFTRVVHYSPRHISRRFKQDLGMTLFEYLALYRIFQAAILLSTSGDPVTRVAFAVGYESMSSFYRDFKNLFSMTPKAFCRLRVS